MVGVSVHKSGNRLNWVSSSMRWRLAFRVSNITDFFGNAMGVSFGVICRLRYWPANIKQMISVIDRGRVVCRPVP